MKEIKNMLAQQLKAQIVSLLTDISRDMEAFTTAEECRKYIAKRIDEISKLQF